MKLAPYQEQYARTKRFYTRVQESRLEDVHVLADYLTRYEDDVWAFFQNCWHLKDWVKNDHTLDSSVRKKVVDAAHASSALMVCADLANGSKHLKLDPVKQAKRKLFPNARNEEIHVLIGVDSSVSLDLMITQDHGPMLAARAAATAALAEWERILTENGLSVEGTDTNRDSDD